MRNIGVAVAVAAHPGIKLKRLHIDRQSLAKMLGAQPIQMTDKVRHRFPQTVFNNSKTLLGFIDSRGTLGTDLVRAPNFFYQTVQTTTYFILLKAQQISALTISQRVDNLIIFTD